MAGITTDAIQRTFKVVELSHEWTAGAALSRQADVRMVRGSKHSHTACWLAYHHVMHTGTHMNAPST